VAITFTEDDKIVSGEGARGTDWTVFSIGSDRVYLDGYYSIDDLQQIIAEMEKHLPKKEDGA
jgi:hypothetical protein